MSMRPSPVKGTGSTGASSIQMAQADRIPAITRSQGKITRIPFMATLPKPPDGLSPEQIFLGHQRLIEDVIAHCCRRSRFQPEEAKDFGQEVMVKLIEDDYAVFRLFEGRS